VSETQVITTFPVGWGPSAVGVNLLTGYVYVSNENDSTVTIISGTAVVDTIPTAPHPFAVDMNPVTRYVYVVNQDNHTISVISDTSIITTIPLDAFDVAANPATGYVYASTGHNITVISSTQIITTLPVGGPGIPRYIATNPNTGYIYTVLDMDNAVNVISGTEIITTVHIYTGKQPDKIAVNPTTALVYVTYYGFGTSSGVAVISGTDIITTIQISGAPYLITVNPTTGFAYVVQTEGGVNILSGTQLIATLPQTGGSAHALSVNPTTGYVYLSLFDFSTKVARISIISGTQRVTTLTLGTRPDAYWMSVLPKGIGIDRSNDYVYVSDPINNAVAVMKDTSVIGQLSLNSHPRAMSVDPVTGYAYTALRGQSIAILNTVLIDLPYQTYLPIVRCSGP
jgi:DNA-binding beta-propeller fold protein YncE